MKKIFVIFLCIVLFASPVVFLVISSVKNIIVPIEDRVVYTTNTGACYHSSGCSGLNKSSYKTTIREAKTHGYRACSICDPASKDVEASIGLPIVVALLWGKLILYIYGIIDKKWL